MHYLQDKDNPDLVFEAVHHVTPTQLFKLISMAFIRVLLPPELVVSCHPLCMDSCLPTLAWAVFSAWESSWNTQRPRACT